MVDANPAHSVLHPRKFQFIGGALCLDLCNTLGGKRGAIPREYLKSYTDLLSWSEQAGLLDPTESDALLRKALRTPAEAESVLRQAVELREAIYRIFAAVGEDKPPQASDIAHLNQVLAGALGQLRLGASREGFVWQWTRTGALDQPLGPIARSAAELLISAHTVSHIRRCEGDNCGWLFIDSSKNHSRRWCDMRDCGNRAKVRRHRLKQQRRSGE